MKSIILLFLTLASCNAGLSQVDFKEFANRFRPLKLPIEDILSLKGNDTLSGLSTNEIIIRSQAKKPQYVGKDGNLNTIRQYYGLYPEQPFKYGFRGEQFYFHPKIIPIGRLSLNEDYVSLIIKPEFDS